jgi:glutamine synthetase
LIEKGVKKDEAILQIIKGYITESKDIRFDGDGYSEDWVKEAARRGLVNISNVPDAMKSYLSDKAKKLFTENGVFSEIEIEARTEVELEKFTKKIQIEARVVGDLAVNHIIPTAIQYMNTLIENVQGLKDIFGDETDYQELASDRLDLIKTISYHISNIKTKTHDMVEARKVANKIEDMAAQAESYDQTVRPYLDDIRYHIDKLELTVDNAIWPLPKYRELLFTR